MYLDFFGFTEKPFDITPDTRFLYLSPEHEEVLGTLLYGIRERRGFMVLTGEVGTGKTTTVRALLNRLDNNTHTALIINPLLSTLDILKAINKDFGIKPAQGAHSLHDYIEDLNQFLLKNADQGRNAVVIIDEAQDLSLEALEMLRLLSNLETQTHKLLQLLLVGQPELETKLEQDCLRQLRQRIQIRQSLHPLNADQTRKYILFRINHVTQTNRLVIQPKALDKIHQFSGGVPRLINTLADLTLMAAFAQSTHVITQRLVALAAHEVWDKSWSRSYIPFWERLIWKNHKTGTHKHVITS